MTSFSASVDVLIAIWLSPHIVCIYIIEPSHHEARQGATARKMNGGESLMAKSLEDKKMSGKKSGTWKKHLLSV
jgi:hypothetical protein